jgi:hypothetical protein
MAEGIVQGIVAGWAKRMSGRLSVLSRPDQTSDLRLTLRDRALYSLYSTVDCTVLTVHCTRPDAHNNTTPILVVVSIITSSHLHTLSSPLTSTSLCSPPSSPTSGSPSPPVLRAVSTSASYDPTARRRRAVELRPSKCTTVTASTQRCLIACTPPFPDCLSPSSSGAPPWPTRSPTSPSSSTTAVGC